MNTGYTLRIGGNNVSQSVSFKPQIMIVEGTYTIDTMPPFEPYDDTLVNSKCNLKSIGRNFYSSNDFYTEQDTVLSGTTITSGNHDYVGVLPKQKFVFLKGVTYHFRKLNATGTLPYGRIVAKGTPWSSSTAENGEAWYFDTDSTSFTALQNFELYGFKFIKRTSGDAYSFDLQITVENSEELIPYEESSMLVDRELGEFDYIDNVGHLLVKQTSQVFTFDGSSDENWAIVGSQSSGNTNLFRWQGVSGSLRFIGNSLYSNIFGKGNESIWGNDIECIGNTATEILIRLSKEKCPDLNSFKTWLASANLQVVFKLSTPTTEPINLEAGYQVWNSGLQIQETETLPYILEKEYAVSLYSQVLAITSIVNSIPDDVASKSWVEAYIATQSLTEKNYLKRDDFVIATSGNGNIYKHNLELVSEDKQTRILITLINKTSTAITRIIDIVSHFSNIEYGGRFPASGLFVEDGVSYLVYYIRDVGGVILKVGLASFTGTRTEKDVNNVTINDRVETLLVASTE